jgi:hypothetical protein
MERVKVVNNICLTQCLPNVFHHLFPLSFLSSPQPCKQPTCPLLFFLVQPSLHHLLPQLKFKPPHSVNEFYTILFSVTFCLSVLVHLSFCTLFILYYTPVYSNKQMLLIQTFSAASHSNVAILSFIILFYREFASY